MDLGLNEEQRMLRDFARDFLEKECPESLVRAAEEDEKGYVPEFWRKMADQGWQGLIIPEEHGGGGRGGLGAARSPARRSAARVWRALLSPGERGGGGMASRALTILGGDLARFRGDRRAQEAHPGPA